MRSNKGIAPLLAVGLIAVIVVACVAAYFAVDYLSVAETATVFDGDIGVTIAESNLLDRDASVTTTSDSYQWFSSAGAALELATDSDFIGGKTFTVGTEKTVTIYPEDLGTFWLYADPGTDFFMSPASTKNANSEIVSYERIDVDDDNNDEYVFEVDVSATKDKLTEPSREYSMVLVEEDTARSLNAPADQDSTGTGTQTGKIEWQLTIAEMKGVRLARVYVTSNETTFKSQIDVTSISITDLSVSSVDDDGERWEAEYGVDDYREPLDCPLLTIEEDPDQSYVSITVKWESYFAAGTEAVDMTISVITMGANEATDAAITDTVSIGG